MIAWPNIPGQVFEILIKVLSNLSAVKLQYNQRNKHEGNRKTINYFSKSPIEPKNRCHLKENFMYKCNQFVSILGVMSCLYSTNL